MAELISPELARELIRDGNTDRLNTDPHAVDKLNQSVIEEFRANQDRVRWSAQEVDHSVAYDGRS
jgi:hypothetical protein